MKLNSDDNNILVFNLETRTWNIVTEVEEEGIIVSYPLDKDLV